jgi:hypothetical protein
MKLNHYFARVAASALLAFGCQAFAAPGAHGPNGEHLDGSATQPTSSGAPRMEASSEMFELVGRLAAGEFSMFVNRYETNEPVNGATVELELGKLKAVAQFQPAQGDYAVADANFIQALSAPGTHAMVIMVTAGAEADLLEGSLHTAAAADAHGHDHGHDHDDGPGHGHGHELGHGTTIALIVVGGTLFLTFLGWLVFRRPAAPRPAGDAP